MHLVDLCQVTQNSPFLSINNWITKDGSTVAQKKCIILLENEDKSEFLRQPETCNANLFGEPNYKSAC